MNEYLLIQMKSNLLEEAIDFLFYHPEEQSRQHNDEFNKVREKIILKINNNYPAINEKTKDLQDKLHSIFQKNYNVIPELVHKGGRGANYDFFVPQLNKRVEFKVSNSGRNIWNIPQLFQVDADEAYVKFFYEQYLDKVINRLRISIAKPTFHNYLRAVRNIQSTPFFREMKTKSKKINIDTIVNSSITEFLKENINNVQLKNKLEKYLENYLNKDYLIWSFKDADFFFYPAEETTISLQMPPFIHTTSLMFLTNDNKYIIKCMLRWKNGKGILKPAYQVSLTQNKQQFRIGSIEIIKKLNSDTIKQNGIYFTPLKIRQELWAHLSLGKYLTLGAKILEPSCGSGEFITDAIEMNKNFQIYGCEINKELYESAKLNLLNRSVHLIHQDFLKLNNPEWHHKFDIIIGNPPYYETQGKINIATLFLIDCLDKYLKPNGVLAFVLPRSFLNNRHLEEMRQRIAKHYSIIFLKIFENEFYGTNVDTIAIIIQKKPSRISPFVLHIGNRLIFHPQGAEFQKKYFHKGVKYLKDIEGITIKTGPIVWNEHKGKLSDAGVYPLIYAVEDTSSSFRNKEKKKYLTPDDKTKNKLISVPFIIVSRGYGVHKLNLQCKLIHDPNPSQYFIENHLNIIQGPNISILKQIEACLKNEELVSIFSEILGNGQISKTELEQCFPLALNEN